MKQQWIERPEGGNAAALRWFIRFALWVGRPVARILVMPITFYFLLRRGPERRASRSYLTRVAGQRASWRQVWRHLLHFAVVGLDRIYLLAESLQRFDIRTHGVEELMDAIGKQRGIFLFGSHVGSYEVLRVFSQAKPEVEVRAVLDVQQTPMMTGALAYLNPKLAAGIINARKDGTQIALEIKEALDQRAVVTMLVDRERPPVRQLDEAPPTSSFPSGHTAATIALWGALAVLANERARSAAVRNLFLVLAFVVPLLVASSRMYRGMHFLSDVLGGWLLGLAWLGVTAHAFQLWRRETGDPVPPITEGLAPDALHKELA